MAIQFMKPSSMEAGVPRLTIKDVVLIYGHPSFMLEYWPVDEDGPSAVGHMSQGGVLFPEFAHEDPFNPPEDSFLSVCKAWGKGNQLTADLVFSCSSRDNARDLMALAQSIKEGWPVYVSPRYVGRLTLEGKPTKRRFVCWDLIGKPIAQPSIEDDRQSFLVSLEDHTNLADLVSFDDLAKIVSEYHDLVDKLETVLDDLLVK